MRPGRFCLKTTEPRILCLERAAYIIYLGILVVCPLLFGAVHTYVYTLMTLGVLISTLMLVWKNIGKDRKSGVYEFRLPNISLNYTVFILLLFFIVQIIPVPGFLLEILSPEALVIGKKSLAPPCIIENAEASKTWFALAPYSLPVRMSIIRLCVYGLFFIGLTQVLNSQKRIEFAIFVILMIGCFEALYGLAQAYSGSGHILWCKKSFYRRDVTGTYINRNHFAGLMEMVILLAAGFSAALSRRRRKKTAVWGGKQGLRQRISRYLSGEQRFNKRTLILFAGVVMGIGLLFSSSRGGIISAACAMLCMSLFYVIRKGYRKKGLVLLSLFFIASVYAFHIGVDYTIGRFKSFDAGFEVRSRLAGKTMDMFRDFRLTGVGVGNFQYAYPRYQSAEDKKKYAYFAHNDWAQFMAEAGIAGIFFLLTGMSYYIYRTIRLWRDRTDPFAVCLGIVPLAAMVAMGVHSISDFNLHIPANFLTLAAITAIGYSALHLKRHGGREKALSRHHTLPFKYKGFLALLSILLIIVWSGSWTIRHFMAEANCNTVPNSTLNRDLNPPLKEIRNAVFWDGRNAQYHYKLALELIRIRDSELLNLDLKDEDLRERRMMIISALEDAIALNPFVSEYHLRLGWEYTYFFKDLDYNEKWLPSADICMKRAAYFMGEKNPRLHVDLGNYWVMRSKTIAASKYKRQSAWDRACRHYKKARELDTSKALADEIKRYVWVFYPDEDIVREVVPE